MRPATTLTALALLGAVLAGCAGSATDTPAAPSAVALPDGAFTATVTRITDGDTLWVQVTDAGDTGAPREELKLRLLRIDTPELGRGGESAECLAERAATELERLAPEGSTVRGAYDVERRDRYGRELVHLWTADGVWVNGELLARGYAQVVTYPPNTAYDDEVRALESAAREADRGLWDPTACPG